MAFALIGYMPVAGINLTSFFCVKPMRKGQELCGAWRKDTLPQRDVTLALKCRKPEGTVGPTFNVDLDKKTVRYGDFTLKIVSADDNYLTFRK
jgi:hypothetical protein